MTVDTGAKAYINDLSWSADGQRLAVAYNQSICPSVEGLTMHVLDLSTWVIQAIGLNQDQTNSVLVISPDGEYLATTWLPQAPGGGFYPGSGFDLYQISSGKVQQSIDSHNSIENLEFSPTGYLLLSSGWSEPRIALRNVSRPSHTLRYLASDHDNNHPFFEAHFSSDGKYIAASRHEDNDILIWRVSDGALVHYFNQSDTGFFENRVTLAFSPRGDFLVATDKNKINIWDLETEKIVRTFESREGTRYHDIRYSPDGKLILVNSGIRGYPDTFVFQIWDAGEGRLIREIGGGFSVSPNGQYLARGEAGCSSKIYILGDPNSSGLAASETENVFSRAPTPAGVALIHEGQFEPGSIPHPNDVDIVTGSIPHKFRAIGFEMLSPRKKIDSQRLILPHWSCGWGYGTGLTGPDEIILWMCPKAPSGTYAFAYVLPDGQPISVSFVHTRK